MEKFFNSYKYDSIRKVVRESVLPVDSHDWDKLKLPYEAADFPWQLPWLEP